MALSVLYTWKLVKMARKTKQGVVTMESMEMYNQTYRGCPSKRGRSNGHLYTMLLLGQGKEISN